MHLCLDKGYDYADAEERVLPHPLDRDPSRKLREVAHHEVPLRTWGVRSFTSAVYASLRCGGTPDFLTRLGRLREVWRNVPPVRPARFTPRS